MEQMREAIHELAAIIGRPVKLMEVCGTHTVAIFRHGIRDLLPETIRLLSGPGCPVCVTAIRDVDTVIEIARQRAVISGSSILPLMPCNSLRTTERRGSFFSRPALRQRHLL